MSNERTMITFGRNNKRFNLRTAGIAIDDNYVLLHTAEKDDFWSFPGGRIELGETSSDTLVREIKEELNAEVKIVRLLWFVENFFVYDRENYHEICFYYLMQFKQRSPYLNKKRSFQGVEDDADLEFKWFPIDSEALGKLPLYPSFLQQSLTNLPTSVEHLVWRE